MRKRKGLLLAVVSFIIIASAMMVFAMEPQWRCPTYCHPYQVWLCYQFNIDGCEVTGCLRDIPDGGQFWATGWCGDPQR
jgi:hypothetical protein